MFDSINDAKKTITVLTDTLKRKGEPADAEVFGMIAALQQLFEIAGAVDQQGDALTPEEITDIGDQGLTLIDNLLHQLASQNYDSDRQDVQQVALVIAQWTITHHGVLTNIQSVVDALATLANATQDKTSLTQLAGFMGQLVHACGDVLKHDLDNSNPARPWRVLNINRGIVATRSHDLAVINTVYSELIQALPMDAPVFFKEGMSEMVRLNYPESVRELVQEFYDRTKLPAVH